MYHPTWKCKLCNGEFETKFNFKTATEHGYGRSWNIIPAKFVPCLHQIICYRCAKVEKYMECPFCERPIKKVIYNKPVVQRTSFGWKSQTWNLQVLLQRVVNSNSA